ncbi:MAG: Spy/CpxP family protein refolding chaperone [bacterium]
MKALRIAALGLALMVGSTAAYAQGGGGGGGRGAGRGPNVMAGIELTDAQKAKQGEIMAKYMPDMQKLRADMQAEGADRPALMKKQMEMTEKRNAEVRAILTPEQQAVFDKNVKDAAEARAKMAPPAQ